METKCIISNYKNSYTISMFIRMCFSFLLTKLFWKKARIIIFPSFIHGKKNIRYGKKLSLGAFSKIDAVNLDKPTLFIGDNCDFGHFTHISAVNRVVIGDNFLCGQFVYIGDSSHGLYSPLAGASESSPLESPSRRFLIGSEIIIGKNVWVGEKVSILPGSIIDDGCIIGANSVVNSHIPPYTIAVGAPAVPIKKWNFNKQVWERIK